MLQEVEGHLEAYLQHLLERKLNSPRFMRQIQSWERPEAATIP
jgi:hypothetical protein